MTEKQINAEDPLFLVNPNSGKLSSWDKADKIRSIYPGQKVNIVFPNSPDESAKISAAAFKEKRLVVACGGDGLANLVAHEAVKHKGTLSILPMGRGNDFAKSIGINSTQDLIRALKKPKIHNSRYLNLNFNNSKNICLTSAGVGLLSEAAFRASKTPVLQGGLLYAFAALTSFINLKIHSYEIILDGGKQLKERLLIVVAASSPYAGGGMQIAPEAWRYENKLNLLYAKEVSRSQAIRLLKKVFSGKHLDHPKVTNLHIESCHINTAERTFWAPLVYGDGEYFGNLPVRISLGKEKLSLLIPG